jgi:hypothetical protein
MTVLKQVILNWVVERLQLVGRSVSEQFEPQGTRSRPVMPWQLLRQKITNDPYYRFESLSEIKIASEHGIRIDANTAAVDDWLRLPGRGC